MAALNQVDADAITFETCSSGTGDLKAIGQIWSGAMMLAHFGEAGAAAAVERAIADVLAEGGTRTPDLGGNARTKDLGAAITAAIR